MGKRKSTKPCRYGSFNQSAVLCDGINSSNENTSAPRKLRRRDPVYAADLQNFLDNCTFYISLHKSNEPSVDCIGLLGQIEISICETEVVDTLPDAEVCYLYVSPSGQYDMLYFDSHDVSRSYYKVKLDAPYPALSGLRAKMKQNLWFHLEYEELEANRIVKVNVYITRFVLQKQSHPSDVTRISGLYVDGVQNLLLHFKSIEIPSYSNCPKQSDYIEHVLAAVSNSRKVDIPTDVKCTCDSNIVETVQPVANQDGLSEVDDNCRSENISNDLSANESQGLETTKTSNRGSLSNSCLIHLHNLKPELRPYQAQAVQWMLTMERKVFVESKMLHPLFVQVDIDSHIVYFNKYGGFFVEQKPAVVDSCRGGILADEMGLGKTVEVLACILLNPRLLTDYDPYENNIPRDQGYKSSDINESSAPHKDQLQCICGRFDDESTTKSKLVKLTRVQCALCGGFQHAECVNFNDADCSRYFCPHCWILQNPIPSKTTLIISPVTICGQWFSEIRRHVEAGVLNVLTYMGVSKHGFIQPETLAGYDIILTTYETLRKEIDYTQMLHCNSNDGRKLRQPKRFMTPPSPLMAIEWWRICLDEAQMIECTSSKTAEMVLKLSTVNRWCVTGTPIQRSLEDLFGLVMFLGIDPFCFKNCWSVLINHPCRHGDIKSLSNLLNEYMWRSTKEAVIHQIKIPKQEEIIHWLTFLPVESHFYKTQHDECRSELFRYLNRYIDLDIKLSSLDKLQVSGILGPLLKLRQACCHPQVVRGQFVPIRKSIITMEEILDSLIKKTTLAAEEAHRRLIASLNGTAGVHIINQDFVSAVEVYRNILRSVEEHKDRLKTDRLQQLHTLHNLAEILDIVGDKNEEVGRTIRDDNLKQEAEDLKRSYLEKYIAQIRQNRDNFKQSMEAVNDYKRRLVRGKPWWIGMLVVADKRGDGPDIIARIKNAIAKFSNTFYDVVGLQYVMITKMDELDNAHLQLQASLQKLSDNPSSQDIGEAVDCHLRPAKNRRIGKCTYCRIHKFFNKYENKLFSFSKQNNEEDEEQINSGEALFQAQRRGTWADSDFETTIKIIHSFSRTRYGTDHGKLLEEGNIYVKLFDALKKEFRAMRGLWMHIADYVASVDELNMATTRLRSRYPDEPDADPPLPNILDTAELDSQMSKLKSDELTAESELRKKLGQLLYLKNLSKAEYGMKGGSNPELCPVCRATLGKSWAVLQCGHCFCVSCTQMLMNRHSVAGRLISFNCPICRQRTDHGEISFVDAVRDGNDGEDDDPITVVGSHSTKVEAVIRRLLKIHREDRSAKSLVFSTWIDVLNVLVKGLKQNDINYQMLKSGPKYQKSLDAFKNDPEMKVLLLPIKSGSKGLNLIEATHVLLIEPLLNPGHERQAVGRVHRIGQTRRTYVHKFLVKNTIEDNIQSMLCSQIFKRQSSTKRGVDDGILTLRDLRNLFV